MENKFTKQSLLEMNVLSLSFIGDAVHTLYVRNQVLNASNSLTLDYHKKSIKFCSATSQAMVFDKISEELMPDELEVAKRARNAKSHKAKNSSIIEYKKATALEAVFGYLYLLNEKERLNQLLDKSYKLVEGTC